MPAVHQLQILGFKVPDKVQIHEAFKELQEDVPVPEQPAIGAVAVLFPGPDPGFAWVLVVCAFHTTHTHAGSLAHANGTGKDGKPVLPQPGVLAWYKASVQAKCSEIAAFSDSTYQFRVAWFSASI